MRTSRILGFLGLSFVLFSSGMSLAQPAQPTGKASDAPAGAGADAPKADAPAKERRGAAGYGYSDKPTTRRGAVARPRAVHTGPSAAFPSFTTATGGASRLVVHLSGNVPVEEHKAEGSVTYILKGVHVNRWNDTNPLVTVHFNTPLSQARLVPRGSDLHLVLDLRAAVSPTFKVTATEGGGASLEIELPSMGRDFVPPEHTPRTTKATKADPAAAVAPKASKPKTPKAPKAPVAAAPAGPKP
jgi:hypothetical protein